MVRLEGQELGGCKLIRKLGEGGMGEVYLAEELDAGNRLVAMKIVRAGDGSFSSAESREIARRFEREAALLANLSHPNVLPIYGSGVQDDYLYIVMLYAQEGSLADAIRGRARLKLGLPVPLDLAVDIISQVASALQYCHDRGIVHRDVKPGNVLIRIEPGGHWRMLLADFGVARPEQTGTARTVVTGTFAYMAPEQFSGEFSPASDQYALAVMAYQLLAGRVPFEGDLLAISRAQVSEEPPPMGAFNPDVPPSVEAVIRHALAKDPTQRYSSVAVFAEALRAVASGVPYEASPEAQARPAMRQPVASRPATRTAVDSRPLGPTAGRTGSSRVAHGASWPVEMEQTKRRAGSGRVVLAVLALVLLVVGLIAAPGLLNARAQQVSAQQTAAAQTAVASSGTAGTTPGATTATGTETVTTTPSPQATATSNLVVPTATAPASVDTDVTSPPPAPSGVGAVMFSDPAPNCDSPAGPPWTVESQTHVSCAQDNSTTTISGRQQGVPACIEQLPAAPSNGYISAIASSATPDVILGFRLSQPSGGAQSAGYYFTVTPLSNTYTLQIVSGRDHSETIASGTLPATLAAHFAPGVTFRGNSITLYINGVQIDQKNDGTYSGGAIGLCAHGTATFKDAQIYGLKG